MKKWIYLFGLLFFMLSSRGLPEQLDIGVSYNGYYNSNIFMNSMKISDFINSFALDINYGKKTFNLYLEGEANMYLENSDFDSFKIEPGFEYLSYLKGRNYLYANISYPVLQYKESFTDFNYSGPALQIGGKFYISPSVLFKSGYNFQQKNYSNFSSFDFHNHNLFAEINKFFQSQTTLRFQSGINYRYYPHIADIDIIDYDSDKTSTLTVPNIYGLIKISKGFGVNIGIYAEFEQRKNFSGLDDAQILIQNSYVSYPYNDNFLWDGSRIQLGIKVISFKEIEISTNISYSDKYYPGILVTDENGDFLNSNEERKDGLFKITINIQKKFKKWWGYLNGIFKDNQSNDPYFHYNSFAFLVGIDYYL